MPKPPIVLDLIQQAAAAAHQSHDTYGQIAADRLDVALKALETEPNIYRVVIK